MKRPLLYLVWLLMAVSIFGTAADTISVYVDTANPPFMYLKDGKAAGIYPALIQEAFRHMKVPVDVQAVPWSRALGAIDMGRAGVGGIYKNSERLQKYDYSDLLYVESLVVYFNTSNPITFNQISDLSGKRVGVLRGWSYGDDFDTARKAELFVTEEVGSDEQNFLKLEAMRIDLVIAIVESGDPLQRKGKNIGCSSIPLSRNSTFLAFSKSKNCTELLRQFNQAIAAMKRDGEFEKLVSAELAK